MAAGRPWFVRRLGLTGRRYGGIPVASLVLAGAVLGVLTVGWFLVSLLVAHNDVATAGRESVGVSLALLVLASMIGAARSGGPPPSRR